MCLQALHNHQLDNRSDKHPFLAMPYPIRCSMKGIYFVAFTFFDAFFRLHARGKHQFLRLSEIMMPLPTQQLVKKHRNLHYCVFLMLCPEKGQLKSITFKKSWEFWCFCLHKCRLKTSESILLQVFDALFRKRTSEKHQRTSDPAFPMPRCAAIKRHHRASIIISV